MNDAANETDSEGVTTVAMAYPEIDGAKIKRMVEEYAALTVAEVTVYEALLEEYLSHLVTFS